MSYGDATDVPRLSNEYPDLLELLQRHALVTFVHEVQRTLIFRIIPHDTFKNANRAVFRAKQLARNQLGVNGFASDLIELARPVDRQDIRVNLTTTNGWKDRHFVSLVHSRALMDIFFVNRRENHGPIVLDPRILHFKVRQHVSDSRINRYIELQFTSPNNVLERGKE